MHSAYLVMVVAMLGRIVDSTHINDHVHGLKKGIVSGARHRSIRVLWQHLEQGTSQRLISVEPISSRNTEL